MSAPEKTKAVYIPGIKTKLEAEVAARVFALVVDISKNADGVAIINGPEVVNALLAVIATLAGKTRDDELDTGLNRWADRRRAKLVALVKEARTLPNNALKTVAPDGGLLSEQASVGRTSARALRYDSRLPEMRYAPRDAPRGQARRSRLPLD